MSASFPRRFSKHDEWRRHWKKHRRSKIRQAAAKKRDEEVAQGQKDSENSAADQQLLQNQKEEIARERAEQLILEEENQKWIERERLAQEQWAKKQNTQENVLDRKQQEKFAQEEKDRLLCLEQRRNERVANIEKQQKLQEVWFQQLNNYLNSEDDTLPDFLTNNALDCDKNGESCSFFTKTGACRYGESCSRSHFHPTVSRTLLIPSFYDHYGLSKAFRDEFNSDSQLEFEDHEIYEHFREFYQDVLRELRSAGRVVQLKVCCNHQSHLRGNVYVQYSSQKDAVRAFMKLQGRWYDGRQLSCRFVHIASWKAAICGLFLKGKCSKGRLCNFLHVFRNPDGMFREADRDFEIRRHPTATGAAQVTPRDRPSAQSPTESSVRTKRQWRWSESPPSKSMKLQESTDGKEKSKRERRGHSSSSKSRSRKKSNN